MRRLVFVLLIAAACGPEVAPPSVPAPTRPRKPRPAKVMPPAPVAKPQPPGTPFHLAWTVQTRPFNKGVALSKALVAALGSRSLSIVEKRTGKLLAERDVCFTFAGAYAFTAEDAGALVCEQEVQLLSVPDLEYQGSRALPGLARRSAFGEKSAAIAFEEGPVRVYRLADWAEDGETKVDHEVTALALSEDGRHLAIGLEQGDVILVDRQTKSEHRIVVKTGLSVEALAFSPDASLLFSGAGPDTSVWSVADRRVEHRFRAVAGVTVASWLGGTEIGSAGKDGIFVLDLGSESATSMPSPDVTTPVAMATSDDANVICAADREGSLSCYARGGIPTRAIPTPVLGADEERMAGRVLALIGKRLTIKAQPGMTLPRPGVEVRLMRYTEAMVGDVRSARWIEIVTAQVLNVKKDVIHMDVDDVTPIPGVDDPLTYDTAVRLVWKRKSEKKSK